MSKTGPLSAYLSAPIISKLQSCSDFHFSCLTATPSRSVLSMESSAILPQLCNIPSSASFPFTHLYSLPLVYPLGNANSHLPFFQSRYLYDNVFVTRFYLIFCTPPPHPLLTFCSLVLKYLLRIFYFENTSHVEYLVKTWKIGIVCTYLAGGKWQQSTVENKPNMNRTVDRAKWSKNENGFLQNHLRKAKHKLVCLKRVSEKLRDTHYDSFAHISWFKTRKTGDLHLVVVQQTRIV